MCASPPPNDIVQHVRCSAKAVSVKPACYDTRPRLPPLNQGNFQWAIHISAISRDRCWFHWPAIRLSTLLSCWVPCFVWDKQKYPSIDINGVVERISAISRTNPLLVYGSTRLVLQVTRLQLWPMYSITGIFAFPSPWDISMDVSSEMVTSQFQVVSVYVEFRRPSIIIFLRCIRRYMGRGTWEPRGGRQILLWSGVNATKCFMIIWRECRIVTPFPFFGVCLEHIPEENNCSLFFDPLDGWIMARSWIIFWVNPTGTARLW